MSHSKEKGYCWGTNEYFANRYKISERSISAWINGLKKKGLIRVEMIFQPNSRNIQERRIRINDDNDKYKQFISTYGKNLLAPMEANFYPPVEENFQDNNKQENKKQIIELKEPLKDFSNILLSQEEMQLLNQTYGEDTVRNNMQKYSKWKTDKRAVIISDFNTLSKWIERDIASEEAHKQRQSWIKESKVDVVTDEALSNLPFQLYNLGVHQ